jgi:hypothetical protein
MRRPYTIAGSLFVLLCLIGCGDATSEVSGTVTIDGQVVEHGAIRFVPVDEKSPPAGGEIKNGKYLVRAPIGEMKVTISVPKVIEKRKQFDTPDSPEYVLKAESLPPKYSDIEQTELRFEVTAGKAEKDFPLKK